ncbi:conserved hypothetical protein [metagenome]|uniref:HTH tetR-type domain-containing protein n=1 Tax=metagenome TaxID=256318 RepID=A0A2P2C3V5_9ZZZZ
MSKPEESGPSERRARRDPEGRRRMIEEAAADLLLETGGGAITHRQVASRAGVALGSTTHYFATLDELRDAALKLLTQRFDGDLAGFEELLQREGATPAVLAASMHEFNSDSDRVRRAVALYAAAAQNADAQNAAARSIATYWSNGFTEILARHTGQERARLVSVFSDGVMMHTSMQDEPLSLEVLVRAISAILGPPSS